MTCNLTKITIEYLLNTSLNLFIHGIISMFSFVYMSKLKYLIYLNESCLARQSSTSFIYFRVIYSHSFDSHVETILALLSLVCSLRFSDF